MVHRPVHHKLLSHVQNLCPPGPWASALTCTDSSIVHLRTMAALLAIAEECRSDCETLHYQHVHGSVRLRFNSSAVIPPFMAQHMESPLRRPVENRRLQLHTHCTEHTRSLYPCNTLHITSGPAAALPSQGGSVTATRSLTL